MDAGFRRVGEQKDVESRDEPVKSSAPGIAYLDRMAGLDSVVPQFSTVKKLTPNGFENS